MEKHLWIHERALKAAKHFRQAEAELLSVMQEVEREKVHLELGYSSMHEYATVALNLSEANASNFITVSRKAVEVPELKLAVEEEKFSVTKARKITPVINKENAGHWIELATTLPQRQLEKAVADACPELPKPDRSRPLGNELRELKFSVTEENFQRFRRAQDLESQRTRKAASYDTTLGGLLDFYLAKKDSLTLNAPASVAATRVKRRTLIRDLSRCTFISRTGRRCRAQRWLDIHHILPRAAGGSDAPENLTTLCSAHHRLLHRNSTLPKT